jgi:phosphatidylserine/phosphatidylglycerophosphate/cardiolipin synthase-like enzyme
MIDHYINLAHNDRYIRVPRFDRSLRRSIVTEWRETNRLLDEMRANGVGVKMINPLGFLHCRALQRDHKKLVIIRRRYPLRPVAYIGGIQPSEHNAAWHDFMVKMTGGMVPLLQDDYDQTWNGINVGGIAHYSDGAVLTDAFGHSVIIPAAQGLINQARKRVIIQSAYLWGRGTIGALASAPPRGVDTSVIVPLHNHKKVGTPSERVLRRLGDADVHVFRYRATGGMSHARGLLADGYGLFGSNTFNAILAGKMREIAIITGNPSLVSQLDQFLGESMHNSDRQYN